jgi:hypothetical protein
LDGAGALSEEAKDCDETLLEGSTMSTAHPIRICASRCNFAKLLPVFRNMPHRQVALILVLAIVAISVAGFLWVEYTIPGVWPPWIGPVEAPDGQ